MILAVFDATDSTNVNNSSGSFNYNDVIGSSGFVDNLQVQMDVGFE